ncbi:MAG: EAL domain-containing protein [Lachnospiraceae bacterium]|nr:EAL domain-containing protein [Lachnospiraceae bacterium]
MNDFSHESTYKNVFTDKMEGGSFVWRRKHPHGLLYANFQLAALYECVSVEDFLDFTGGSFNGMVNETDLSTVWRELQLQMEGGEKRSGYFFFNIRTKQGNVRRLVMHWTLEDDPGEGEIFYSVVYLHSSDIIGSDFDSVTGLYGKKRFNKYIELENSRAGTSASEDHALVYLNLVNFKLLNIEKGTSEGDACLKHMADTLRGVFGEAAIARIADDHFAVFTDSKGIEEKTHTAEKQFRSSYGSSHSINCKFGIYCFGFHPGLDVESAVSLAKLACDYIKRDDKVNVTFYSRELANKIQIREYVTKNIDTAIEKNWIKIYFQPVVRSLTGSLCGMESLVRWIDPELGFLRPDQFISALENERLIDRLDSFVVDRACAYIRERMLNNQPMVPVSVNFSRLDFLLRDMLEEVERAVRKYEIPRDALHIEVTESMIASDEELMRDVIESFRNAGYEVWMDDFGSGYSSLNLLKDYNFDTLKLDMRFLTPFTEKSKSVVRSTVSMAKDIGIKTVAEGVETLEQLDFLREIGCGMIQGYYYGKPEPLEEVFAHMKEKNITVESRRWRHFYEVAGRSVRDTDVPLEIIEYSKDGIRTLYMNKSYKHEIGMDGLTLEEIDDRLYNTPSPLLHKYMEMAQELKRTERSESFYYSAYDSYYCFTGQVLVENDDCCLIYGSLTDIGRNEGNSRKELLDSKLRELNLLFSDVYLIDLNEQKTTQLLGANRLVNPEIKDGKLMEQRLENAIRLLVHSSDRDRARAFINLNSIRERLRDSSYGYIEEVFRVKQTDGNYIWSEHYLLPIPGTGLKQLLYCIKPFTERFFKGEDGDRKIEEAAESSKQPDEQTLFFASVMRNFLQDSNDKFFWKDTGGRFVGASRAFLDYFAIDKEEDLIGKTNDDLGWLIDPESFNSNERAVLEKGEHIDDAFGKCVTRGAVRTICYSQFPLYAEERIQGLICHITDWDNEQARILNRRNPMHSDPVTGLLNAHAFIDNILDFADRYAERGCDYAMLVFTNVFHERIKESFGENFANKVLHRMARELVEMAGMCAVLSRTRGPVFGVIMQTRSRDGLEVLRDSIVRRLEAITEVEGNSVTISIRISGMLRSDFDGDDRAFYEQNLQNIMEQN